MKKNKKKSSADSRVIKKSPYMKILKGILIVLTLVYPVFMVIMTGSGLIYNSESNGEMITNTGIAFIVSGALMAVGTLLVCLKKNIVPVFLSSGGFALCMVMLHRLTEHADKSGWSDKYTMEPISGMYTARILPVIIPFALTIVIALIQFFSYEAAEKRREKRRIREEKENEAAPPII